MANQCHSHGETISLLDVDRQTALGYLCSTASNQRLPLCAVHFEANLLERAATVKLEQKFVNSYKDPIEAVYIFPLSGGAVKSFQLKVGDRIVEGLVKERAEARAEYQKALDQGKRAALLEQERDDVFTMQVGNIKSGEEVSVVIEYFEVLPYFADGTSELRLPLVVAPRYIPGEALPVSCGDGTESDTDIVRDASRITPPLLVDGFDPEVSLSIKVNFDKTFAIEDLACSQHAIKTKSKDGLTVSLANKKERLNRDFVLSFKLGQKQISSSCVLSKLSPESYFGMLSILPPGLDADEIYTAPRDVIFLLDRSGSMTGEKMGSASMACSILLNTLSPQDRFSICAFDHETSWLGKNAREEVSLLAADPSGVETGEKFLRGITARGGTELNGALEQAVTVVEHRRDSSRTAIFVVITDGEVGDESRILKRVQETLGDGRIFSVGVDTAVNAGFLKRLANLGGGTCALVSPGMELEEALIGIGREIGVPLITDLAVENDGSFELAPGRKQDLFEGRPCTVYFETKSAPKTVSVTGTYVDGTSFAQQIPVSEVVTDTVAKLYARARVVELEDAYRLRPQAATKQKIIDLSIVHQVLTRFTAYVAVDSEIAVDGTKRRKVVQPVEKPQGWQEQDLGLGANLAGAMPAAFGAPSGGAWGAPAPGASNAWGAPQSPYRNLNMPAPPAMPSAPAPAQAQFQSQPSAEPMEGAAGGPQSAAEDATTGGFWGAAADMFGLSGKKQKEVDSRSASSPPVPPLSPSSAPSRPAAPPIISQRVRARIAGSGGGSAQPEWLNADYSEMKDVCKEAKAALALVVSLKELLDLEGVDKGFDLGKIEEIKKQLLSLLTTDLALFAGVLQALVKSELTNFIRALKGNVDDGRRRLLCAKLSLRLKAAESELEALSKGEENLFEKFWESTI